MEGPQELRLKVNSRERRRVQDLNQAMDGLREVVPCAQGPSVRKLSKVCTLLLARDHILMLTSSLEEMRRLVGGVHGGVRLGRASRCVTSTPPLPLCPVPQTLAGTMPVCPPLSLGPSSVCSSPTTSFGVTHQSGVKDVPYLAGTYGHLPGTVCPCALCQPPSISMPSVPSLSVV